MHECMQVGINLGLCLVGRSASSHVVSTGSGSYKNPPPEDPVAAKESKAEQRHQGADDGKGEADEEHQAQVAAIPGVNGMWSAQQACLIACGMPTRKKIHKPLASGKPCKAQASRVAIHRTSVCNSLDTIAGGADGVAHEASTLRRILVADALDEQGQPHPARVRK